MRTLAKSGLRRLGIMLAFLLAMPGLQLSSESLFECDHNRQIDSLTRNSLSDHDGEVDCELVNPFPSKVFDRSAGVPAQNTVTALSRVRVPAGYHHFSGAALYSKSKDFRNSIVAKYILNETYLI